MSTLCYLTRSVFIFWDINRSWPVYINRFCSCYYNGSLLFRGWSILRGRLVLLGRLILSRPVFASEAYKRRCVKYLML